MSLAEQIKKLGLEIGLDIIRITHTESFPQAEKCILESIEKGYIPKSEYNSTKKNAVRL